ncbi:MAG: zinc ABC transporter substrate-binding protein [Clostridia bacterium]|nr:zinc ABC transporter substrate-binding protein [Clostridia bacterium]
MKVKKIILGILAGLIIAVSVVLIARGAIKSKDNGKLKVVVTNFASFDFARQIVGKTDEIEVIFLMGPGKDAHSYEPTAQDITTIQNSDLFVYIGGEMENWTDKVLGSLENKDKMKIICIADDIETAEEKEIDDAEAEDEEEEEEGAFDEHIWTSPANAIIMVNTLEKAIEEIDRKNAESYRANADKYIAEMKEVDGKIQEIVDNRVRDRLIFADKMPMQYFIDYYGLKVSAAFSGCSTETEPSPKTIMDLENRVRQENIPVVLYIELNNGKVADTIAKDTGTKKMQINTLHNVSKDDFEAGESWVSLMTRNLKVLKEVLQ